MKLFLPILFVLVQQLNFSTAIGQSGSKNSDGIPDEPLYNSKELITFLARPLKDSLSLVRKNDKFGIIDSANRAVVPLIYDNIEIRFSTYFGRGIRELFLEQLRYLNEYFYGYWQNGNESEEEYNVLLEQELNNPESFLSLYNKFWSDPIFTAKKDNKCGAINKSNEEIIPFVYESLIEFGYDIFLAKKEGKYGILDAENNVLVPFVCDTIMVMYVRPFFIDELGLYGLLKADGKYGLINLFTKQVLLPRYDDLEECYYLFEDICACGFSRYWKDLKSSYWEDENIHGLNGLLIFNKENKYGLLNMFTMQEVTTDLYDSIQFKSKWAGNRIVYLNEKATFLTNDNSSLHPNLYDEVSTIYPYSTVFYFKVENQDLVGVFDQDGRNLLELKWDDVLHVIQLSDTSKYQFIVEKDSEFGVVDNDNRIILPVRYDSISYTYDRTVSYYTTYRKGKSKKVELN